MKTAYELAMERLNKRSPTVKLTDAQKKELAELDSRYAAKIAEREIAMKTEITRAAERGEFDKIETLEKELVAQRGAIQAELEEKKDAVRQRKSVQ